MHRNNKEKPSLIYGRPNALVIQTQGGVQIRSLKNGFPLCHMSLLPETVYSDLNNDGIVDQVQVLLNSKPPSSGSEQWAMDLVKRIENNDSQKKYQKGDFPSPPQPSNLCHAMVLSGVPANEELFSTSLCHGGSRSNQQKHQIIGDHVTLDALPPLIVESLDGRRNTRDVIVALNNGIVNRLHGRNGRRQWVTFEKDINFPTWEAMHVNKNTVLARIQSRNVVPALQPLLLAGENSLAVLSVKTGAMLALAAFPQTSIRGPVLAKVSGGDGTTDVFITSKDGIWCYQISIHPGSNVFVRIMVGLLIMGLMLALLMNRFGQRKDKRSSDA